MTISLDVIAKSHPINPSVPKIHVLKRIHSYIGGTYIRARKIAAYVQRAYNDIQNTRETMLLIEYLMVEITNLVCTNKTLRSYK